MLAQIQIESSHNSPSAIPSKISQDLEDKIMKVLPKPLADWLRYDAHEDTCPVVIFKEWRSGTPVDRLLVSLRGINRQKTRGTYGPSHPQASFV